ncbi:MAG: sugar ABC transporter ATP-binding protein, partial [Phycisphaerae bacterium]
LTLAQRQFVSLARALSQDCRLLIMDEPTASLSGRETQTLLRLIRELRSRGVSILYVSHRLEEVFAVSDRITVLRDGSLISTNSTQELNTSVLIRLMVGRNLPPVEKKRPNELSQTSVAMDVRNLSSPGRFRNISFQLHRGEVLGLAGLVGAGRTEIARAIFGIDEYSNGEILINKRRLPARSVTASIAAGLAMVPEDRQHQGLILQMSVSENLSIVILKQLTKIGIVQKPRERSAVLEQIESIQVRCNSPDVAASSLSGGNQQKLVLGKWLANSPKILLLDEPTRGIDVGAKAQVHSIIRQLSEGGMATLLISSEMQELLAVCDRILVIRNGQVSDDRPVANWTQEELLAHSLPDGDSAAEEETVACGAPAGEPRDQTHASGDHP